MKLALDTNAYSDAARGDPGVAGLIRKADLIGLPFVVLGELRAGFASGSRGRRNEAGLTTFLGSPRVRILFADQQTTHHYRCEAEMTIRYRRAIGARIKARLRRNASGISRCRNAEPRVEGRRERVGISADHLYASLYAYLRKKGTPVPTNDLWIAALAVQHDLRLVSRDGHFAKLPQLGLVHLA